MDTWSLKDIADLGATTFVIIALVLVWRRLGVVTDRLMNYLDDKEATGEDTDPLTALPAKTPRRTRGRR